MKGKLISVTALLVASQMASAGVICSGACQLNPPLVGGDQGGAGALTIDGGSSVASELGARFGSFGPNQGDLLVDGAESRLEVISGSEPNAHIFLGSFGGSNESTIANGGRLVFRDPAAVDNVNQGVFVGAGGTATLNILTGGQLSMFSEGGASSSLDNQTFLNVGESLEGGGNGTVNVAGSGSSLEIYGVDSLAVLNLGLANTQFANNSPARGEMNITSGGTVLVDGGISSGFVGLGRGGNSVGELNVAGAGSSLTVTGSQGLMFLGNDFQDATGDGLARATISDGATVNVTGPDGFLAVGYGSGTGTLVVESGASVNVDGTFAISSNSPENSSQSGLAIIDGATSSIVASTTLIGNGTSADINGRLMGTGTLASDTIVQTGGLLGPGLSPGTLTIDGNLTFDGGILLLEIGGTSDDLFDLLNVTGTIDFTDALIEFAFVDNFIPEAGNTWSFFDADTVVGFDSAMLSYSGVSEDFSFAIANTNTGFSFTVRENAQQVAEPGLLGLFSLGLILFGLVRCERC